MEIVFKYFWLFLIIGTLINAFMLKYRSQQYIADDPSLKAGYNKIFIGIIFLGNIPWAIMGIGILLGQNETIHDYFFPRSWNITVLAFYASIGIMWILGIWWVYFKNGAEFIEKHPGFLEGSRVGNRRHVTARQVKLFLPLVILATVIAFGFMWSMEGITPPNLSN